MNVGLNDFYTIDLVMPFTYVYGQSDGRIGFVVQPEASKEVALYRNPRIREGIFVSIDDARDDLAFRRVVDHLKSQSVKVLEISG